MKLRNISNATAIVGILAALAMILYPAVASATGAPQVDPATSAANSTASAGAKSSASSAIDLSLMNSANGGHGGVGGSVKSGDSYAFVSGSATPLPPGLCPKGDSNYVQVLWGLLTVASSSTRTEMECLDKVLGTLRDTAPKPVVVNYLTEAKETPKPAEASIAKDVSSCALKLDPAPAKKKHVRKPQKECGKN